MVEHLNCHDHGGKVQHLHGGGETDDAAYDEVDGGEHVVEHAGVNANESGHHDGVPVPLHSPLLMNLGQSFWQTTVTPNSTIYKTPKI